MSTLHNQNHIHRCSWCCEHILVDTFDTLDTQSQALSFFFTTPIHCYITLFGPGSPLLGLARVPLACARCARFPLAPHVELAATATGASPQGVSTVEERQQRCEKKRRRPLFHKAPALHVHSGPTETNLARSMVHGDRPSLFSPIYQEGRSSLSCLIVECNLAGGRRKDEEEK